MGTLLSQLEEQNKKLEKQNERLEKRIYALERDASYIASHVYENENKIEDLYTRMQPLEKWKADSNAAEEQASPHPLSFKELERKKGFYHKGLSGIDYPVICLSDVETWLKTRGLDNLIGE